MHPIFIASGAVCLAAWVFLKKPLDGWLRSDSTQVWLMHLVSGISGALPGNMLTLSV